MTQKINTDNGLQG